MKPKTNTIESKEIKRDTVWDKWDKKNKEYGVVCTFEGVKPLYTKDKHGHWGLGESFIPALQQESWKGIDLKEE